MVRWIQARNQANNCDILGEYISSEEEEETSSSSHNESSHNESSHNRKQRRVKKNATNGPRKSLNEENYVPFLANKFDALSVE